MKLSDFAIPGDLDDACSILRALGTDGFPMAGGTSLHFLRFKEPRVGVDLSRIGLSGIAGADAGFEIGATTSIHDLRVRSGGGWVLDRVARRFVTQQIRNMSTLGGNVCRVFWWSDFPVALLALGASFTTGNTERSTVSAAEFFDGQPAQRLQPGELLHSIHVPTFGPGKGFGYRKNSRVNSSFSLATAAAGVAIRDGKIAGATVAVGASVPLPRLIPEMAQALEGQPAERKSVEEATAGATAGISWKGREGMSDDYAAELSRVVIADAVMDAVAEARETAQ